MATTILTKTDTDLRDEWVRTVNALATQIAEWVQQEPEWSFEEMGTQEIEEPPLGRYTVTIWSIRTPEGEVRLEPIGRNYPGRGIVEVYAWPTAYRVRLIQSVPTSSWRVLTDSGIYLRHLWDHKHFVMLIHDLVGAEDMIAVA